MKRTLKRIERLGSNFDWLFFINLLVICLIGLVVLSSAGNDPETGSSAPMKKQAISMLFGFAAFFVACFCSTSFWRRSAWLIYTVCLALLIANYFLGDVAGGARRWISIGFFRFQPSEFMKVGLILVLARVLSSESAPENGHNLKALIWPGIIVLFPAILTLRQPDLGTSLCQCIVAASLVYLSGVRTRTILILLLGAILAAVPAWHVLNDFQRKRLINFVSPEADPLASGYHAIQSKIAVGSGALTGKGYLKGTQTQLRFLPEQTTDFFFSVLAEEWGFFGSLFVVVLYMVLIYRILAVSSRVSDRFSALVTFGVAALFFWQSVINIGMVTGALPVVGITLPLLSYGGSSVLTLLFAAGLVAGVHSRRFLFS